MAKKITVIGAGPGGYVAAVRAAQLGAEVTIVDQDNVGGTCLNRGCIPSKVMKTSAQILEHFKRAKEFGIDCAGPVSPNLDLLMERKETVIRNQREGIHRLLKRHKIRFLAGAGFLQGANLAGVKLADGKKVDVPWDGLILALGSQPQGSPPFSLDGKTCLSSSHALNVREIPESLLIVGGGVIGCEFAFIFSAFGSDVSLVEPMGRLLPLPSVDAECSKVLQREMKKRKIKFMVDRIVDKVEEEGNRRRVTIGPSPFSREPQKRNNKPITVVVDKLLVCIGRRPHTTGVGLEKVGIDVDDQGWIIADEGMKTSVPGIYAIGDVLGPSRGMLAHVASAEGITAAENAMGGGRIMDYSVVPSAIFTMPEVANVGLTEIQARDQGYNGRADSVLFRNLGKAQVIGELAGFAKIVSDADTGKILGVHLVGPHVTDLIAEGVLAMQLGGTVKDLAETIHAHPTLSEIMVEASFKALDRPMHG